MTNQLFRDYRDGRIPVRPRIRPGFYFLPTLANPTAPTMAELAAGVNISEFVTATGLSFDELAETMRRVGDVARDWGDLPPIDKPAPPKPWAGNIATQKRRKRL